MELLIVEDKVDEAIYAQYEAVKRGICDIKVVTNLEDALRLVEQEVGLKAIVSDLFYPVGNIDKISYVNRLLPIYENYESVHYEKNDKGLLVIRRAIDACSEVFGVSAEEYVTQFLPKMNTSESIIRSAMDSIKGIKDYSKWENFQTVKKDMISCTNFPSGVFLIEEAKKRNIPIQIVTSTYHHDLAFEVVSGLVKAPYQDNLVDGRKNWGDAIDKLKIGMNS